MICGTVSDADAAESLIDASVKIEGTSLGAVTDIDDLYFINVRPGTYSLTASYVCFRAETRPNIAAAGDTVVVDFDPQNTSY